MKTISTVKNWAIGKTHKVLENIHQKDVNIALYERDTSSMKAEIDSLLEKNIELRANGDIAIILDLIKEEIQPANFPLITEDIKNLLEIFNGLNPSDELRFLMVTVNNNMCRKFHTDVNDIRMLCTYSGPGTLWLKEDNINRGVLSCHGSEENIFLEENEIQQAKTGAVIILKGSIYPIEGTNAVVHRSPTIEESGVKRLLLRIDTSRFKFFQ
ncbi:MAG: DUF1826 domain-containing protein [Bacteroidota bacterium]